MEIGELCAIIWKKSFWVMEGKVYRICKIISRLVSFEQHETLNNHF